MRVVGAGVGDVGVLVGLNAHVQGLHRAGAPEVFREVSSEEVAAAFRAWLERADARVFIGYVDDVPAGYVLAFVAERAASPFTVARRWLHVDQISVDPQYQGRGVGRALLEAAFRSAREAGIADVELETWAFNSVAATFFQAAGFRPQRIRFARRLPS